MQYSTFFTFRHFILFFGCSFVAEANTSESLYHTFTSRSRDIIIYIFPSFAAEANANAILYIFHFQTLHTVVLGAHMWQRLTKVNHSTILLLLEVEISLFIFFLHSRQRLTQMQYSTFYTFRHFILFFMSSYVAEANTSESLYLIFKF